MAKLNYNERTEILEGVTQHARERYSDLKDNPFYQVTYLSWLVGYLGASISDNELLKIKNTLLKGN